MNILAISHLFPTITNKTKGIFSARQFCMMHRLGAEVTVVVPAVWMPGFFGLFRDRWKDYADKNTPLNYPGLNIISVPYLQPSRGNFSTRWVGLFVYLSMKKIILELHDKKPFDVIYGKCFFPEADAGLRLSKFLQIPVVGEGIGSDVHIAPDYSRYMYRHFVRLANGLDGTVADGQGVADRIDSVSNKHTDTIHGLVDLEQFRPVSNREAIRKDLNLPADRTIILFVGHFQRAKGIFEMIEAFCRVQKTYPEMILKICGDGGDTPNLAKIISEKGLSEIVHVVGRIDPEEVSKWMQASDLLILASYNEGMPNVVMEAMACGLPVVATTVGGLPAAVGDCQGAILVEPKNVEQLTDAIARVARDEKLRVQMGTAARKKAEKRFGCRQNVQHILDCLEIVVNQYNKSRR
jgi:teichuronic acid biosynthesis glycosyltransferase TuaC